MTGETLYLRSIEESDRGFLKEMAYESAAASFRRPPSFEEIVDDGQFEQYFEDWGKPYDDGLIAFSDSGEELGAAWHRVFPDKYLVLGEARSDTPEVLMAVAADARGRGVGRALLGNLMQQALYEGIPWLRLQVAESNSRALGLYESVGFISRGRVGLRFGTEEAAGLKMFAPLDV